MSEISSEQINELATALAKAQAQMTNPKKDKTAKVKMRTGGEYAYKYTDLASVRDIVVPILTAHDIAVVQFTEAVAAGILLHTRFIHSSGQWIDSTYPITMSDRPQDVGSAITYGRRYCLSSMCGLASEEDDDGNVAQDQAKGNGTANKPEQGTVYQRATYNKLVDSIRLTKDEAEYSKWKTDHKADIESLNETYFPMLRQAVTEHRASFAKEQTKPASPMIQAWPPEIKETAKVTTKATPFQDEVPF